MKMVSGKPGRLGEKLRYIRLMLGLSQSEMLKRLECEDAITYHYISKYELGVSEPPLLVLLRYGFVAGVYVEDIIDDELDLPAKIPGIVRYQGIKRHSGRKRSR